MENTETLNKVAFCGTCCMYCEAYACRDDINLKNYLVSTGFFKEENLPCEGCRANKGKCPILTETCSTYECVTSKGLNFCSECNEYPCQRLNPCADRIKTPHNLKVYNLAYIQGHGIEKFLSDFPKIKANFYQGKLVIGKGPEIPPKK